MNAFRAAAMLADGDVIPPESDVALVLRHAEREDIPLDSFGENVKLTKWGVKSAERLGELLSGRPPGRMASSPILRCVDTAQAILQGASWPGNAVPDWRLGAPGPFVVKTELAGQLFMEIGIAELVRRQLSDANPPQGMRKTADGVKLLQDFLREGLGTGGRVSIYVTHDAILSVLVGYFFRLPVWEDGWPNYLEGMLFWRCSDTLHFAWNSHQASHRIGG